MFGREFDHLPLIRLLNFDEEKAEEESDEDGAGAATEGGAVGRPPHQPKISPHRKWSEIF